MGQAKSRGTKEERVKQAVATGYAKIEARVKRDKLLQEEVKNFLDKRLLDGVKR